MGIHIKRDSTNFTHYGYSVAVILITPSRKSQYGVPANLIMASLTLAKREQTSGPESSTGSGSQLGLNIVFTVACECVTNL